jgi:2-dehydro-3-deoxygluconokinase
MVMLVPERPGPPDDATSYRPTVAGAESNVACYLAAFGLRSAWVSRVGSDPFGRLVLEELAARGVDVSRVVVDDVRPTGVAFKDRTTPATRVRYFRRDSAASALGVEEAQRIRELSAPLLHLSGITSALSTSCRDFVRSLLEDRPRGSTISFDVNWRPVLWSGLERAEILRTARQCDVVFVGLDEATALWGLTTPADVRVHLPEPRILVVKQGAAGATVYDADAEAFVPALTMDVVEPVGAGDAFAGGFLTGLYRGLSPARAARLGVLAAGSALSAIGDVGALPPTDVVDELLDLDEAGWRAQEYPAATMGEGDDVVADR